MSSLGGQLYVWEADPKSCYVMLPEVEACPDTEVQGEALFTSLNSVPEIPLCSTSCSLQ